MLKNIKRYLRTYLKHLFYHLNFCLCEARIVQELINLTTIRKTEFNFKIDFFFKQFENCFV